jgi:hypothetical protein
MFKTIHPNEHESNRDLIDPFLKKLKASKPSLGNNFSDISNATFILAEENPDRIGGGAVLLKKKEETLHPQIRERLDAFVSPDQHVWFGTVALNLRHDISGQDFVRFSKLFYRELYEALMVFGRQEKTAFLCLRLPASEHLTTDILEYWPYVMSIRPKESGDGFFHSVLALTGTRNETTLFWKSLGVVTRIKDLAA